MNTQVATVTEAPRRSLLVEMATRYGMEPKAFADTIRATVVPQETSNEEFAAFLVVAREYDLNPLTKEIYAFPKKGGGIQPIVPIDGWTHIINANPALDGIEFDDHLDEKGNLASVTCRLWRKDRSKPISVTEYMVECKRGTDTWAKWPRRMLRHKALIQCARYAFGLAGIVDPDEAERMDATPARAIQHDDGPPAPPQIENKQQTAVEETKPASDLELVESGLDNGEQVVWAEDGEKPAAESAPAEQQEPPPAPEPIISLQDMAREAAMRGKDAMKNFYKSRTKAEKAQIDLIRPELDDLVDAAEGVTKE